MARVWKYSCLESFKMLRAFLFVSTFLALQSKSDSKNKLYQKNFKFTLKCTK